MNRVTILSRRMEWIDPAAASRLGDARCYCSIVGDCRLLGIPKGGICPDRLGHQRKGRKGGKWSL